MHEFTRRLLLLKLLPSAIIGLFFKPKEDPKQFLVAAPAPKPEPPVISEKVMCGYLANEIMRTRGVSRYMPWLACFFEGRQVGRYEWTAATKLVLEKMLDLAGVRPVAVQLPTPFACAQVCSSRYIKDVDALCAQPEIYAQMCYEMVESVRREVAKKPWPVFAASAYVRREAYMLETFITITLVETRPNTFGSARFTQEQPDADVRKTY
jgi:hypothetical protein